MLVKYQPMYLSIGVTSLQTINSQFQRQVFKWGAIISQSETQLMEIARKCRVDIVEMVHKAGAGHPGGSLSAIDFIVGLYGTEFRFNVENPDWEDRDRFIMSKGHASPAVYSMLHQLGVISKGDIDSFRTLGSTCQGHVDMKWTDGVDFSAGSLGMGLSFGLGCALAARMDSSERNIWVMIGDGETQEGQIWEAAMAAPNFNLENLYVIIDKNNFQQTGPNHQIMNVDNLKSKWESFNWHTEEVDGHNIKDLLSTFNKCKEIQKPKAIVANTIKGKGFSFSENNNDWHHSILSKSFYEKALKELK